MNNKFQDITTGNRVKITHPNGDIYDFETTVRCSAIAGPSGKFTNPTKVPNIIAPAKAITADIKYLRRDTCAWDSAYINVPIGYRKETVVQAAPDRLEHTVSFIKTPDQPVYIKGTGCK